jgi:hypothetical protein
MADKWNGRGHEIWKTEEGFSYPGICLQGSDFNGSDQFVFVKSEDWDLSDKVCHLLNGDLAAACGLPQALLVGRMVDKLGLDRSTVVIVLDELQSLIRGEPKS